MFIDLVDLESKADLKFDICIVGAGAAGITLAKSLSDTGLKIALLESGGRNVESETQKLYEGRSSGLKYMPLEASRLRVLGGTTGHWAGQSKPLDKQDFKVRDWVPNSGWPISYDEFIKYIPAASKICGIPIGGFSWNDVYDKIRLKFPFSTKNFNDLLMRYSSPPRRFGEYFRDEIGRQNNLTCFLHANVTEVVTNEAGSHVSHVNLSTLNGQKHRVYAKKFILACGGIENSRLLLLSNRIISTGIGNQHDQVGRYFMEHPNFDSGLIRISEGVDARRLTNPFLRNGSHKIRLDFKLSEQLQQQFSILNHSAFLLPKRNQNHHLGERIGFMDKVWKKVDTLYSKVVDSDDALEENTMFKLRIRLEQAPIESSRIKLDHAKDVLGLPKTQLNIQLSDLESRTIAVVQEQLAKELGKTGIGRYRIDFDPLDSSWTNRCGWQYHHCGGTRMHLSPKKGVVDTNSKVFGIDNLWIAGSSVFPTSGHANPTLNLVALTLRLAEHLKRV